VLRPQRQVPLFDAEMASEQHRRYGIGTFGHIVAGTVGPVPGAFSSDDDAELLQAERDVTHAFEDQPFDFSALLAVSNVFRTATAVRNHMERDVLSPHQLSWSAFVVLFVLRVWGAKESHELAAEAGITGGTLTGVVTTLERRGFARRGSHPTDGRRVVVSPTAKGRRTIDQIMPLFNQHESAVTADLTVSDRRELARLLRTILRTLDDET
jgi:MarR family transcriptional regulator, organic hydroperoxide resistance regulator